MRFSTSPIVDFFSESLIGTTFALNVFSSPAWVFVLNSSVFVKAFPCILVPA